MKTNSLRIIKKKVILEHWDLGLEKLRIESVNFVETINATIACDDDIRNADAKAAFINIREECT